MTLPLGDEVLHPGLWEAFAAYEGPEPQTYVCPTCGEEFVMRQVVSW